MPIQILESPEPRSEAARRTAMQLLLVSSDAADILVHELRRYCNRQINGRSFLVAGHRGAGKTTLVESAWLSVWKESEVGDTTLRPLFVQLHGPSLFKSPIQPSVKPAAPKPKSEPEAGASQGGAKPSKTTAAKAKQGTQGTETPDTDRAVKPDPDEAAQLQQSSELRTVLEQISLALHRAVSQEFARDLWRREPPVSPDEGRWQGGVRGYLRRLLTLVRGPVAADRPSRRFELAAQFEAELYESPEASRLRDLFSRAGALPDGVLRRRTGKALGDGTPGAKAWRELVALVGICDAYRLLSAKVEDSVKETDKGEEEAKSETALDSSKANLLTPLYSLLSGGLVGVGTGAAANSWFVGAMSGLIAALGSAFVFKVSHTRSRTQTSVRQMNIVFDRSPATLERVLPILVSRLLDAGLAPMFVVDELDKVDQLNEKMKEMVHHLKKLVAESAFFCFLTDREYFEQMARKRRETAYAVEYTYFTHDVFVVFGAKGFHQHLGQVLSVTPPRRLPGPDDVDAEVLPYVLLHRSRMHAIDLRRRLARWRTSEGTVNLATGEVVSDNKYRLDVLVQLAIEATLESDAFRERLDNDSELLRMAYDAMYYITRRWVQAHEELREEHGQLVLDESDVAKRRFERYLAGRMGTEDHAASGATANPVGDGAPAPRAANGKQGRGAGQEAAGEASGKDDAPSPPPQTVRFLYARVQELASLLADPKLLAAELTKWNKLRRKGTGIAERPVVSKHVLHAVGLEYGEEPVPVVGAAPVSDEAPVVVLTDPFYLLERADAEGPGRHHYTWRYEPAGKELFERPAPEWRRLASYIQVFDVMLSRITQTTVTR